jgi:uncharacterized protein with von Willebrand factor type A (vWA) domain
MSAEPPPLDLTPSVVGFVRALRAAGVDASTDRVHAFVAALDVLDPSTRGDVHAAGRVTLCAHPDDLDRYDRVFAAYFDHDASARRGRPRRQVRIGGTQLAAVAATPGSDDPDAGELPALAAGPREAAATEVLRHRDVVDLDARERAELHRLLATFRLPGATRRSRRHAPARRGQVDRRRTVRSLLAAGGEPGRIHRRAPRRRPRRVVLLVDVSGSMAGYAEVLLRFAHAAVRGREAPTEVFTLGTRLTRVTDALAHRDPDVAMRAVAAAVPDWEGGTRLGATLRTFVDRHGRPGLARGAVVVVLSDGWDTGEPAHLGVQVERLSRLAHRVVWANPRAARPGFAPTAGGMAAALPWCDALVEGHSLAALEHLAAVVAGTARPARGAAPDGTPGDRTGRGAGGSIPTRTVAGGDGRA